MYITSNTINCDFICTRKSSSQRSGIFWFFIHQKVTIFLYILYSYMYIILKIYFAGCLLVKLIQIPLFVVKMKAPFSNLKGISVLAHGWRSYFSIIWNRAAFISVSAKALPDETKNKFQLRQRSN